MKIYLFWALLLATITVVSNLGGVITFAEKFAAGITRLHRYAQTKNGQATLGIVQLFVTVSLFCLAVIIALILWT